MRSHVSANGTHHLGVVVLAGKDSGFIDPHVRYNRAIGALPWAANLRCANIVRRRGHVCHPGHAFC
jgi:hypothetical protein